MDKYQFHFIVSILKYKTEFLYLHYLAIKGTPDSEMDIKFMIYVDIKL